MTDIHSTIADTKDKSVRQEYILYAIIWTVVAIFPLISELREYSYESQFDWHPVLRWWTGMIPLLLLFLLHTHVLIPFLLKKRRNLYYALSVSALLVVIGVATAELDRHHREHFESRGKISSYVESPQKPMHSDRHLPDSRAGHRPPPHFKHHGLFPFPVIFKIILAVLMLGINVSISLAFNYNREHAARRDLENFRLQEELKYLKQQISPHFFMNVLNNIHEMVEEDVSKSQDMILELSQLMRYVLYESENNTTTLASESKFISSYVGLMRGRYPDDTVKIILNLPEQVSANIYVPPLLFISFIENAFKHGVSYMQETEIDINLSESDGWIQFDCTNTIPVTALSKSDKGGVGLANVRRRLDLLYGDKYSLQIDEDKRYSVKLIIPSI